MQTIELEDEAGDAPGLLSEPVRAWFRGVFPGGPSPAQRLAWPPIAAGENVLLVSPTGTGKTLAGFLAILDGLFREHAAGTLTPGIRCVYVSPLRSLGYDIERNLAIPLAGIRQALGLEECPIRVGVRTGDTSPHERRKLRERPPHLLITTPESLSLMLSQSAWADHWAGVDHLVVDEAHALVPTKRGADLAATVERLAAKARRDPQRIGLSATCRPPDPVARFLVGPSRACRVLEAPLPPGSPPMEIEVEALLDPGECAHRGLTYMRLVRRLRQVMDAARTTVVFANTRPLTERLTHDLRQPARRQTDANGDRVVPAGEPDETVAAHHSALDARRRREVEDLLKNGRLRAVVTSTSLELGVDIGTADLSVQVGLPGGVARCVQRVGRSGHRLGEASRGLILAATPAEVAGGVVTARAAREGRIEPLRMIEAPLDVVCQQLVAIACAGETAAEDAFAMLRKAGPMESLRREDFDACLAYLAGDLAAPAGAYEAEPGAAPKWSSPRLWRRNGWFGIRSRRVLRWFWSNVGTIVSEESARVMVDGVAVGTLDGAYAERLALGDRFVLDGRSLELVRREGNLVHARGSGGEGGVPVWQSDRQSLSSELAGELAAFRVEGGRRLAAEGPMALRAWLMESLDIPPKEAGVLACLLEAQERHSEVPAADEVLVEESPDPEHPGLSYAFHVPLNRSACEALGRASAARLGRRFGRDMTLQVADLGWAIRLPEGARLEAADVPAILGLDRLEEDVLEGLDRGELPAKRFRHVAETGLMVLGNPEPGRRVKVGGMGWVSTRLYPLVKAASPDHPLLRETRREILRDILDVPAVARWLETGPAIRFRRLPVLSPFAGAWICPAAAEAMQFESPSEALHRLHARLTMAREPGGPP
ncbi:DEAD-box ATP-dependent RNA helicase CshB [Aquisphaera giovannonii]|uniref:DEAD-box ATP-dependent RNA helicase CshB n=1 Tax=Aquisphaera giovannonii TaxID=406548 RepID=A0A5B9W225_9BACT|nr:DEAD/DEAH box helicase [Aquisphaera giovannonii]QEH34613.1 DEAD-box ATP-dependent RNA helicase CshB [Aquisphaera giovannonii]